jgi:two-component system cell cycle sensor histidine kinase/response regulator CckA
MATPEAATILVVDDDAAVATLTAAILRSVGYRVEVANAGEEALKLCAALPKPPSLVVADVVMAGTTGAELSLQLEAEFGVKRCLFISGFPEDSLGQLRGLQYHLLRKPFTATDLLAAVLSVLREPGN